MGPRLTVITPSYNQGEFLERTIESVLDQGYDNLEYVILDGGSSDGSVEIIRRHERSLAWWTSEPDLGQTDAINKGLRGTEGEIVAYINSDDFYLPGAFDAAVEALAEGPRNWVAGAALDIVHGDPPRALGVWQPQPPSASEGPFPGRHWWLLAPWHVPQPSAFWRRALFERHGLFRDDMTNAFDAEFMVRLALAGEEPELLRDRVLAARYGHSGQKSRERRRSRAEIRRLAELHRGELSEQEQLRLRRLAPAVGAWRAFREVAIDPGLRLGGDVLEHVPERMRPPIRGRDRRRLVLSPPDGEADGPADPRGLAARVSRSLLLLSVLIAVAFVALTGNGPDSASDGAVAAKPSSSVLVYSRTTGFRHDSIPAGIGAIRKLGKANGFRIAATENPGAFTRKRLRRHRAVVFLNTTGDVLARKGQAALRRFIRAGGGFVGIHSAADTEYEWPFYGRLVGAYFESHPAVQQASIDVGDRAHPSTRALPARWTRTDEWYNFRSNPRGSVHVLAALDEGTYSGGTMGADHPIAWCHRVGGGRAWYTAGGHSSSAFAEPLFLAHLLGGVRWASGDVKGSCPVP